MEKKSWVLTLITQLSLCCGLYLAFNLGEPQQQQQQQQQLHPNKRQPHSLRSRITTTTATAINGNGGTFTFTPLDFYFISVHGGPTPPTLHRSRLLNTMEKVIKAYDPKFVLNLAAIDPILNNPTDNFQILTLPWYTTTSSKGEPVDFVKKIELPLGKTLDIISINTAIIQDSSNMSSILQLQQWLAKILEATDSHWRIVIGFHQLDSCKSSTKQLKMKRIYEPLHRIFVKYGVNAYLSRRGCADYALRDGIAYIGLPSPMAKGPSRILGNGRAAVNESSREDDDGFLLHRISSLEMDTYFVTSSGKVTHKVGFQQRGAKAV